MKLGLYSEIARKHIVEAREFIKKNKFKNTSEDIRKCRQAIVNEHGNKLLQKVSNSRDFYSISSARDLIFHVQEHRFTIPQISQILDDFKLTFLGFINLPQQIKTRYSKNYPEDETCTCLEHWDTFENNNPDTFEGMYEFWVKKKE